MNILCSLWISFLSFTLFSFSLSLSLLLYFNSTVLIVWLLHSCVYFIFIVPFTVVLVALFHFPLPLLSFQPWYLFCDIFYSLWILLWSISSAICSRIRAAVASNAFLYFSCVCFLCSFIRLILLCIFCYDIHHYHILFPLGFCIGISLLWWKSGV